MNILMNVLCFIFGFFCATIVFLFLTLLPVKRYFRRKGRIKDAELICAAIEQSTHDVEERENCKNEGKEQVKRIDRI